MRADLAPDIRRSGEAYAVDAGHARAAQLKRLQRRWGEWQSCDPQRFAGDAPRSLDEFVDRVAPTGRADLVLAAARMSSAGQWRATGGSTGEPVRFPVADGEIRTHTLGFWTMRGWIGITPDLRCSLVWGHAHLLGEGFAGRIAAWVRTSKDVLLGYQRLSAYDLSERAVAAYIRALARHRPHYIIGYAGALARIGEFMLQAPARPHFSSLRVVVATGESFAHAAQQDRVAQAFRCPVLMEYGSVETGPLAQEVERGRYRVLWRDHLLEAAADGTLLVTSLYPRAVPLVRYGIGDQLDVDDADRRPTILTFRSVRGRCNPVIEIGQDIRVHSEAVAHCVRDCPTIEAYQLVIAPGHIRLRYLARNALDPASEADVRARFKRIHDVFEALTFEQAADLAKTPSGKVRQVVHASRS